MLGKDLSSPPSATLPSPGNLFQLESSPIVEGTTVVEASAGTGKTYCLTGLVLRLLLEGKVRGIGQILVVTFTVAATEELVHRIRDALQHAYQALCREVAPQDDFIAHLVKRFGNPQGQRILRQARLELDDLTVATIHGFAKRVLDQNAFESGLPFEQEFIEDERHLLLEAARDFWRQTLYRADPSVAAIAAQRRWTPTTFLADFEDYSRHPNTEILPEAHFEDAQRHLQSVHRSLRKTLRQPGALIDLGRSLMTVKTKSNSRLDLAKVKVLLEELARGVQRRDAENSVDEGTNFEDQETLIAAAETLALDFLKEQVYKKDHRRLEPLAIPRICQMLRSAIEDLEHALRSRFLHRVKILFQHHKQRQSGLTFDDLLQRLHGALQDPKRHLALRRSVAEQYQAALIDEFQDTDLVQYSIFQQLFARRPLFLIGDPKQAIYRFRGADVFAYMKARRDAQKLYTLGRNWRSRPQLVASINALFLISKRPFVYPEIPFQPIRAARPEDVQLISTDPAHSTDVALQWLWLPQASNRDEAGRWIRRAVAAEIQQLLASTQVKSAETQSRAVVPGDIAILVRTNRQAQEFRDTLQGLGIPAVLSRAGDIFLSSEMAELERLLAAVCEPSHGAKVRAAAATLLWGDDAPTLLALEEDDAEWQARIDEIADYRRLWLRRGFIVMMQELIHQRRLKARLLALPDGERRLTNLLHAVELLHQASHQQHLSPVGLLRWLETERRRDDRDSESAELRLDSDAAAVQISTIHKSKGLEYNIVFCPYLWESRPVTKKPVLAHVGDDRRVFDFGSENFKRHQALADAERLAEELRLAYVALTRARWRCYTAWGRIGRARSAATSALAYLFHGAVCDPGLTFDPSADEWAARVQSDMAQSFDRWIDGLQRLVDQHGSIMGLEHIDATSREMDSAPPPKSPAALQSRTFPSPARSRLVPWSMNSFSSLSRTEISPFPEAPDHEDPPTPVIETTQPSGIFAFARGRQAGHCLHHLLESCDFSSLDSSTDLDDIISQSLRQYGLDSAAAHRAPIDPQSVLHDLVLRVARTPLPGLGFCFGDVQRNRWQVEEKFYAPIERLSGQQLAETFARYGEGSVAKEYAEQLRSLHGVQLAGFLTGIIDLVFEHKGRWFVVDWKSNHLGDSSADYGPAALWHTMQQHHYVLQYHLYVFALHRYLSRCLPGYDYEQHFGGVYYVFLRGLDGSGWYVDRPPLELIESLDLQVSGRDPS